MKKLYSAVLNLPVQNINRRCVINGIVAMILLVVCQTGFGQKIWTGAVDNNWGTGGNWVGGIAPIPGDQVILDNSQVLTSYVVNLPTGAVTTNINQLTINPTNPNTITLNLPAANTANPGLIVSTGAAGNQDIIINSGGVLRNSSGASGGSGIAVTAIGGIFTINNGGKYIHNTTRTTAGTAPYLATGAGTESGIFEYDVPGLLVYNISASSTNYGTLVLTRTAGAASYTAIGGSPLTIYGSLNINSLVTFASTMTAPLNLFGDFVNNGTAATISSGSAMNFNAAGTQTISGSGSTTFSGATTITNTTNTLAIATSNPISFGGAVTAHGNLKIISGLMNGTGVWTYDAGRTLTFANTSSYPATTANNVAKWWPVTSGPESITMNGSGGITMDVPRTVTGNLDLTSGVITTSSVLTLNPAVAGTGYTGSSNTSYIDGKLEKVGNYAPFSFPVGKVINGATAMVPIDLIGFNSSDPADRYTAEYKRASAYTLGPIDPTLTGILEYVSHLDYWTLDRTVVTPTASANVKLHWTAQSSNGGSGAFIGNSATMVVAQLVAGTWTNFGNTSAVTGNATAGTVDWTNWANSSANTTFNFLTLGSTTLDNPLPITISYIQGAKQNNANLINWKVSCFSNLNATMILQRSSDNRNFTDINTITVPAARCQQPFDYTDNAPAGGTNYYRLKTINDDGKVTYSAVIVILNKATGFDIVSLLPNIVRSNTLLNISSAQKTTLDIVITDAMGRPVQKAVYSLLAGSNQLEINVVNLAAGMYRITGYTAEGATKTIAFVKQ